MKFIHAADLHIDSPLRNLEAYEGAPAERLRTATRDAFANLVALAIAEDVDFVVLAGDLFDGKWPDIQTGLWTAKQFRRLEREGIAVYLLRGNHDALSEVEQRVRWPDNVREFPTEAPGTFVIEEVGVALHGQGFPTREIPEDLAAAYPPPVEGLFNIGVLHTSLTGDPQHDTYAPTTEDVLVGRGYDYWALGHIHARREVRRDPLIVFPGNTQGRHINERGDKGCLLVTVDGRQVVSVEFRPTDVVRWHLVEVPLWAGDDLDELYAQVRRHLIECRQTDGERFSAVRFVVCGATSCHARLTSQSGREEAVTEIRNIANEIDDEIWVEKVLLETSAPVDVDQLRRGHDLMGDLLRSIQELAHGDEEALRELAEELSPLAKKAPLELEQAEIDLDDAAQLRRWLKHAEGLLVTALYEEEA